MLSCSRRPRVSGSVGLGWQTWLYGWLHGSPLVGWRTRRVPPTVPAMMLGSPLAAMSSPGSPLWDLLFAMALGLLVLYGVIRLAVRHGIQDADRRRNGRLKGKV
ncbi:hypothetical protein GCM10023176_57500 [Micromonospora coerulea]|uniref:Uncharacterized protein n=1 Tax=Micromonospora coerulea TaxID=47856 RepID=A0ABP8T4H5_9ACTN